jgi:hypothetical protein
MEERMIALPPEMYPVMMTFLIQVGQWAKDELKERWQLKRKSSSVALDLSDAESVQANAPKLLEEITTTKSITEIKNIMKLVEEKKELIFQYKQAKVDTMREQMLGRIGEDIVRFRLQDFDKKIQTQMRDIADELKSLGLNIDKEVIA